MSGSAHPSLALLLDTMPQGYPATKSGVEVEILEYLFSPEEAAVACLLTMKARTPRQIASSSGRDEAAIRSSLKSMAKKGLVEFEKAEGGIGFRLMPFVVGFYERQSATMDRELALLFERYYREGLAGAITMEPSSHRVIPVERAIPTCVEVMPYQRASNYVEAAKSWGLLNCICRLQKRLVGEACAHSLENCLALSSRSEAFAGLDSIRALSREEALGVLKAASAEGLVHTTANSQEGVSYICNCCSCSCGFLRAATEFGVSNPVARSGFLSVVDRKVCTGCGNCLGACQFGALSLDEEGRCAVDSAKCFGCGLCVLSCPAGALALSQKDGAILGAPPITDADWSFARALNRNMVKEYEKLKGQG